MKETRTENQCRIRAKSSVSAARKWNTKPDGALSQPRAERKGWILAHLCFPDFAGASKSIDGVFFRLTFSETRIILLVMETRAWPLHDLTLKALNLSSVAAITRNSSTRYAE